MIDPGNLFDKLVKRGTDFFTGVPDSLLKNFCAYITDHAQADNHIIAVNEGSAVALASGFHLGTGKIPLVYMQNSGIGNAVNPLLSLTDPLVYRIPLILLIGWRGEPGVKDEPQHLKQGKVTCALLEAMEIPYAILTRDEDDLNDQLDACYASLEKNGGPYAFIVKKDTFTPYTLTHTDEYPAAELTREEAIEEIILSSPPEEAFFTTTGMASRELYELREKHGIGHERDFLTVGSMGHASSLALAAAMQRREIPITCLDGDGAVLMHLGVLGTIAACKPSNLRHIVLNNGAHDSVGGQPTIGFKVDLCAMALAAGYPEAHRVYTREELRDLFTARKGPVFIEVRIRKGNRADLGRPGTSPETNKKALMDFLKGEYND
jgi:phosphonopyruvate decarboxylase